MQPDIGLYDITKLSEAIPGGGGGGLLKYDLGRDVPLRLEK